MDRSVRSRKLDRFKLHGHVNSNPADYGQLFRDLKKIPDDERVFELGPKILVVKEVQLKQNFVFLIILAGDKEASRLVYDAKRNTLRLEQLGASEFIVEKTHLIIDLETRESLIEYNRLGAKSQDIAVCILTILRRLRKYGNTLDLAFLPYADEEFVEEIGRFETIKEVSIRVNRPNVDWMDFEGPVSGLAVESGAQKIDISARSPRGQSLKSKSGIVKILKDLVGGKSPVLDEAKVKGRREDEPADTTISLRRFVNHIRMIFRADESGQLDSDDVRSKLFSAMSQDSDD